jgi:large exoprotein involved in heme utilization and adhesion
VNSYAFKLCTRPFTYASECPDVRLSNDSDRRRAPEPGRTETQTETQQDHGHLAHDFEVVPQARSVTLGSSVNSRKDTHR